MVIGITKSTREIKTSVVYYVARPYFLEVKASTESGDELKVENVDLVMPKLIHDADVKLVTRYRYPKTLKIRVSGKGAAPYEGNVRLSLVYDTNKVTRNMKISKIRLTSNEILIPVTK